MDNYESLVYVNASGVRVDLSTPETTKWWELLGRAGFSAPEIENITQKYANGLTKLLKRQLQPRIVSVRMVIVGETNADRDSAFFDMIEKLMDVHNDGNGKLYARRSDGVTVYLNSVYSSGLSIVEEYRKFHRFTLEFYAADPYFYRDLKQDVISIPQNERLTLHDGIVLGNIHKLGETAGSASGGIMNDCAEILDPIIKAYGVRGSITITNTTTGKVLQFTGVYCPDGSSLIIDTRPENKSVYIENADGTRTSAGQFLSWESQDLDFGIIPGANQIRFDVSQGSYTESLVFLLSEKYLSA